jgi:hypothetical protein
MGGVSGIRISNTAGVITPSGADNSVQLLTHIYDGGSRVALHANYDGKIGIGTTTPGFLLDVSGTFHSGGDATFNGTNFTVNSSYSYIGNNTTDVVSIAGNTMYLPGNGRVGIGSTIPRTRLDVEDYTAFMSLSSGINSEATTPDQQIGGIDFRKHYALAIGASIRQLQAGGSTNYSQAHLAFYTNDGSVPFGSVGPERMRITNSGNVSIGTTADLGSNLNVNSTVRIGVTFGNEASVLFGDSGTAYWRIGRPAGSGNLRISSYALDAIEIQPTTGYVGIGTTNPSYKLDVSGKIRASSGITNESDHSNTRFENILPAALNGGGTGIAQMSWWVSEPNISWTSAGFGYNVTNNGASPYGFGRINNSFGQAYMRFIESGNLQFYNADTAGNRVETMTLKNNGYVGIGNTNPNRMLTVSGDISSNFGSNQGSLWLGEVVNQVASFTSYGILDFTLHHGSGYADIMRIQGNGRVGIGTTNPTSQLHVYTNNDIWHTTIGGASGELRIGGQHGGGAVIQSTTPGGSARDLYLQRDGGYVGIGTANPSQVLSVAGNAIIGQGLSRPVTYDCGGGNFRIKGNAGGWATGYFFDGSAGTFKGGFGAFGSSDTLSYHWIGDDWNIPTMVIRPNQGNVGIGTTNPDVYPFAAKLSVAGNISVTGTKIGWGVTDAFTLNGIDTAHYGLSSNFSLVQLSGYGGVVFATTGTERMRITSGGNVGINTTNPTTKLYVYSTENGNWTTSFENGSTGGHQIYTGYNNGTTRYGVFIQGGGNNSNSLDLAVAGKFLVRGDGNVGIGTTGPTTKLHVTGITQIAESGNTAFYGGSYVRVFNDQNFNIRNAGGSTIANISVSGNSYFNGGNVGIGTTNPTKVLSLKRASICGIELDDNTSVTDITSIGGRFTIDTPSQAYVNISSNNQFYVDGTSVGVHTAAPDPSAALDVTSTTQGFLPPRMSDAEMNSIAGPAAGLIVWNYDSPALFVFDGGSWRKIDMI